MALATYLVDKSALARVGINDVAKTLRPLIGRGLTATAGIVALEMLFSARNGADHAGILARLQIHEWLYTEGTRTSNERSRSRVSLPGSASIAPCPPTDLLIAAIAERHRVSVLHYDGDFELIARITGQPTRWVVSRGSV